MKVHIESRNRQSNSGYHRTGKPHWWVMVDGQFQDIERVRGDDYLILDLDVNPGAEIKIGVGKYRVHADRDVIRQTFIAKAS